jgi:hypothetical protein
MRHPWLNGLDFNQLLEKKIEAPFKPKLSSDVYDVSNFDTQFTSEEAINSVIPTQKLE